MSRNKALPTSNPESIEELWAKGDELGMARAVVRKYARVLDMTDAGRDIKPLVTGMFEAIERVRTLEDKQGEDDTPLNRIMEMAANA